MKYEMDDDARAVARDRQNNHKLIQWLSWCIWRTLHGYDNMPVHPYRLEHFITEQMTGIDGPNWKTIRISDFEDPQ